MQLLAYPAMVAAICAVQLGGGLVGLHGTPKHVATLVLAFTVVFAFELKFGAFAPRAQGRDPHPPDVG